MLWTVHWISPVVWRIYHGRIMSWHTGRPRVPFSIEHGLLPYFFFFPYQSVCITTIKGLVMSFVWICLWHDPSIRVAFLISKPCAPFLWVKGSPQRRWWWWGLITWSLDSWKISFLVHVIGPWAKWSLDTPDICYLSIAQRAGLSHLEYPGLKAIDPAYALPVDVVNRIFFGR